MGDEAREKVAEYLKKQPEIDFGFVSHPLFTSDPAEKIEKNSAIVDIAKKACEKLNIEPIIKTVSFSGDQSRIIRGGIPSIMLGPGNIDAAHTDHECVRIDELKKVLAIYQKMMEI